MPLSKSGMDIKPSKQGQEKTSAGKGDKKTKLQCL
jgi:hypothetical protein